MLSSVLEVELHQCLRISKEILFKLFMKQSEIRALFPKSVEVTQEMISSRCIGEAALRTFIPQEEYDNIFWGLSIGTVQGIKIKVERWDEDYKIFVPWYLNEIKSPVTITFTLR